MKKRFLLFPLLVIGLLLALNMGCDEATEECSSDEVCPGKEAVTTCCTDGKDCVYKYNNSEFPDTEAGLEDLLDAMNCTSKKSAIITCDEEEIKQKLQALLERTKALSLQ